MKVAVELRVTGEWFRSKMVVAPKTQTMQTADCRPQTVQTVQTMQTVQTEYFFFLFLFLHLLLTHIFFGSLQLYIGVFVVHRPRKLGGM